MLAVDKLPGDDAPPEKRKEALFVYRKVTVLQHVNRCGMCGATRHRTRPFWCLGMRICRHCVQANLVSSMALYERYWIKFNKPVQIYRNLMEAVYSRVFYFNTRLTPNQRLEYSCDKIDFPGGTCSTWFFWRPHLNQILDMNQLEREGKIKHAASSVIRAHARRALTLRAMNHTRNRHHPTLQPFKSFSGRDLRTVEFRLRKIDLLDRVDLYHEQRLRIHLMTEIYPRLSSGEDRVSPFFLN